MLNIIKNDGLKSLISQVFCCEENLRTVDGFTFHTNEGCC